MYGYFHGKIWKITTNHCFLGDGIIYMVCPILDSHGRAEAPRIKASASSTCQAFCDEIGQGGAPFGGPGPGPRDATRYTRYDLRLEP